MISLKTQYSISNIWWFWLPMLFYTALVFTYAVAPDFYDVWIEGELGALEQVHTFVIFLAFLVGVSLVKITRKQNDRFLIAWVSAATLSSLYVFVEEISFGQHFVGWEAGEFWSEVNDQQETNLHNTSSWFDQKPRLILLIGVIIGGIIMPLLQKYKPGLLPKKYRLIYPSSALFYIAVLALISNIVDDIHKLSDHLSPVFPRASEVEETCLYYFVLLYLIMLRQRVKPT